MITIALNLVPAVTPLVCPSGSPPPPTLDIEIQYSAFNESDWNEDLRHSEDYLRLLNLSLKYQEHVTNFLQHYVLMPHNPVANVNYMYRDPKCITFRYTTHQVKYHV